MLQNTVCDNIARAHRLIYNPLSSHRRISGQANLQLRGSLASLQSPLPSTTPPGESPAHCSGSPARFRWCHHSDCGYSLQLVLVATLVTSCFLHRTVSSLCIRHRNQPEIVCCTESVQTAGLSELQKALSNSASLGIGSSLYISELTFSQLLINHQQHIGPPDRKHLENSKINKKRYI